MPPALEAEQAKEVAQSATETYSSDDEPPGLVSSFDDEKKTAMLPPGAGEWPPRIDMVMPSTGLLTFSMDQMHAALDSRPQLFAMMTEDKEKKEEKKEDGKHMGQDAMPDGQGKDAVDEEEKGGGPRHHCVVTPRCPPK